MKKALSFLLSVVLILSCTATVFATEQDGGIVVLYTNDVHCAIDGYALLAGYRAQLISEGYTVFTVDAGDAIQGEVIGALTSGEASVNIMNAVGYDFATLGNHEFDFEVPTILSLAEKAEYEYICANFYDLRTDSCIFAPYAVKEAGGVKIGFVGIATPETYSKSTPSYFKDENGNFIYGFCENTLYETVQNAVDAAKNEGAETVVAVGHLGIEGVTEKWTSSALIANTSGIDAFIDGHSHETIVGNTYTAKDASEVLLTSTGTKMERFGKMVISKDGITTELVELDSINAEEFEGDAKAAYESVKAITDGYNEEIEYLFEPIGTSEVELTLTDSDGKRLVRRGETNMGNFVPDAYRAVTGADVAFVNGGGIRAAIDAGDVSRKQLMDVNPWSNEMCVIEVTGRQLADALEYGMHAVPNEFGSFPHASGIEFELHTYVDTPVTVDDLDNCVSIDETMPRRVRNIKVGGEPIDYDRVYTLAGTRYMLQLSGYTMLANAKEVEGEALMNDAEMLIEYFVNHLNRTVSEAMYGNPLGEGRITLVDKAYVLGDADLDGSVDQFDYLLIKRAYFDTYTLDIEGSADVDGNGKIDQMDYLYVKRIYFGTYAVQ